MAGQSVLQTNSPINRVTAALTSANKSKAVSWSAFFGTLSDEISWREDYSTHSASPVSVI